MPAANPVWWRWTPSYPGETVVALFAPGFGYLFGNSSRLALFKGESLTTLQLIHSVQAAGGLGLPGYGQNPSFSFTPEPGVTYYIAADSSSSVSWKFDQRTLTLSPSTTPQRSQAGAPI